MRDPICACPAAVGAQTVAAAIPAHVHEIYLNIQHAVFKLFTRQIGYRQNDFWIRSD